MADGTLNFDTKIDDSGFSEGASSIGNIMKGIGLEKILESGVSAVKNMGKEVLNTGMNFESSMSQVAATMGITTEEIANGSDRFDRLSDAAKKMGAETQFSASNAADALNYLALAGYSVDDSIETLPTVLNLAAAGGMELGDASDMVTDAMSALGLEVKDAGSFVDKMAKTAQRSNTSVSQLGNAILTVGGTAKLLKGGVTEMNSVLGVLADNGIKGAEGGTKLRNVITSLTAPTDQAADAIQQLGIDVFDAEGNMRGLPDIMQDMNAELSGMSTEAKQDIINKIFNKADLSAVEALLGTSTERWSELSAEIENSEGAAANMAETMNDNLAGSLTKLSSAMEGLQIEIYEAFAPALKSAVDVATDCVSQIVTAMQENGVAGAIQAAADIAFGFLNGILEQAPQMIESGFQMVSGLIDGLISALPNVIASTAQIAVSFINKVASYIPTIQQKGFELIAKLANGILNNLPAIITAIGQVMTTLLAKVLENLPKMLSNGVQLIASLANGVRNNMPAIISAIGQVLSQTIQTIVSHLPEFLAQGIALIGQLAAGVVNAIPTVLSSATQLIGEVKSAFTSVDWGSVGSNIVNSMASGISSAVGAVVEAAKGVASSAIQAAKNLLGIASPSKVFKWIGKMSSEGLGIGFTDNIPTDEMSRSLKSAVSTLQKDMAFTVSAHGQAGSVSGITKAQNDSRNSDTGRLLALQEQANKNIEALAKRPIYLGTDRIDRELPKGAVPVL